MKRDVTETYWKLIDKFKKQPTGNAKFFVYPTYTGHSSKQVVCVSYAHVVCLTYLIWLSEQHLESAEDFLKACSRWRKEVGKFAKERTLLERLSRKYRRTILPKLRELRGKSFAGIHGMRTQMSKGLGIFHPDYPPERRKETGRIGGLKSAGIPQIRKAKKWLITDQDGNTFIIVDLAAFCRKHNIKYPNSSIKPNKFYLSGPYSIRPYVEPEPGTVNRTHEGG